MGFGRASFVHSSCLFCDRTDPLTEEDVLPKWIRKYFTSPRGKLLYRQGSKEYGRPRKVQALAVKLKVVCRRCNNEWMSRLENGVKSLIAPMIGGIARTLAVDEQALVARWAMKTALLLQTKAVRDEGGEIPSKEFRTWLLDEVSAPPQGAAVWMIAMELDVNLPTIGSETHGLFHPVDGDPAKRTYGLLTAFFLGYVGFIVSISPVSRIVVHSDVSSLMSQIWPATPDLSWPPRSRLKETDVGLLLAKFLGGLT